MLIGNRVFVVRSGRVETKAVMRGCADSGSCGVNVLKTQCRGDAGLLAGLLPPEPPGERRFAPE